MQNYFWVGGLEYKGLGLFLPVNLEAKLIGQNPMSNKYFITVQLSSGCVRGGWLGFLMGVSLILGSDIAAAMDFGSLMPAMAVALLAPLYGYFFKIITMQLE